jgi:hypothetical protein
MILYYTTFLYHEHRSFLMYHKEGELKGYQLPKKFEQKYCCEPMKIAMNEEEFIVFGDNLYGNMSKEIGVKLVRVRSSGRYETTYDFHLIKFCPFCGQAIELKEKEIEYVNKPN